LLYPHETLRRLFEQFEAMLEKLDPVSKPWQAPLLNKWMEKSFYPMVSSHHDIEEEVFFPWLATRAELPKKYSASHEELMKALNEVRDLAREQLDATKVAQLRSKAKALIAEMNEHMDEEERELAPLMAKHFTHAEEEQIIADIVTWMRKKGIASTDACHVWWAIQDWGTPEQIGDFHKKLPLPVRFLLLNFWYPDLQKTSLKWVDQVQRDQEPAPQAGYSCVIC